MEHKKYGKVVHADSEGELYEKIVGRPSQVLCEHSFYDYSYYNGENHPTCAKCGFVDKTRTLR